MLTESASLSAAEMATLPQILGSGVLPRILPERPEALAECLAIAEFASPFNLPPETAQLTIAEYR